MTNAEWMIKNGYKFRNVGIRILEGHRYRIFVNGKQTDTYECQSGMLTSEIMCGWLDMEHKEQILNDEEKQYLSAVIKPFSYGVQSIYKHRVEMAKKEYIVIDVGDSGRIFLPYFKVGAMYRGMELNKYYTLEELGL